MRKLVWIAIGLVLLAALGGGGWYYWTHRFDSLIGVVAPRYDLDPALVKAIIHEESFFNPRARSTQNAVGLMQVTPVVANEWAETQRFRSPAEAAASLSADVESTGDSVEEVLTIPVVSLHAGCWYMRTLLNRYGGEGDPLAVALAAYNAGPTNVERWVPAAERAALNREQFIERIEFPVTRGYVRRVIGRYDGSR